MVKTAILRLFVTDPSEKPFQYCMNNRPWKANSITFNTFNATIANTVEDCRVGKATHKGEFVSLDISDWFRRWVTDRKSNYGITISHQGIFKNSVGFSSANVKSYDVIRPIKQMKSCR